MALLKINRDQMSKKFFQYVLESTNIMYILFPLAENEANIEDEEGLSHPLFYLYILGQRKYLIIFSGYSEQQEHPNSCGLLKLLAQH